LEIKNNIRQAAEKQKYNGMDCLYKCKYIVACPLKAGVI
jgi:hypothetical protein